MEQTKTCISLIDGSFFDLAEPEKSEFNIKVIAHSLSRINRYTGHIVPENYSVAEHCVHVSHAIRPQRLALVGLLHDASEAFVGDVASPLKKILGPAYTDIEDRIQEEIARRFDLPYPFPVEVHEADKRLYHAERQEIAPAKDSLWHTDLRASRSVKPEGWRPNKARRMFLRRFEELTVGT